MDDVEQRDGDVGGEAMLVADLGGAEDVDGGEVEVVLHRVVGRLLEPPSLVVWDHLGVDLLGGADAEVLSGIPLLLRRWGDAPVQTSFELVEPSIDRVEEISDLGRDELEVC